MLKIQPNRAVNAWGFVKGRMKVFLTQRCIGVGNKMYFIPSTYVMRGYIYPSPFLIVVPGVGSKLKWSIK